MILFILLFILCLISYCLHTYWHYKSFKGVDFRQRDKAFNVYTHVLVFTGYLAYGFMIYTDPSKVDINIILRITGALFGIAGLTVAIVASVQKRGYEEEDHLITTGIYSKIRNPMYLGLIFIHIGFPLYFESLITLLSALIWVSSIFLWKYWEEKHLANKFGEQYIIYKRKTIF